LFADDTCLFIEVDNNRNLAAIKLNEDLLAIAEWSRKWLVKFSPDKTKSLIISNKPNTAEHPPCCLNDDVIMEVTEYKHLGIIFSHDLSWTLHLESVYMRACQRLGILRMLSNKLDRRSIERLYYSCILPQIEYADILWAGAFEKDLNKLDTIHHSAARIVTGGTRRCNINCLMEESGWNTLSERRRSHKLTMFHKIVNGKSPPYLIDLLPPQRGQSRYTLRSSTNYPHILARLRHYSHSFIPTSITEWNTLNDNIKNVENLHAFKQLIMPKNYKNMLYYYGSRRENIILSRIRIGCSGLNSDLHRNLHVIDDSSCKCGYKIENSLHYFFHCPLYQNIRITLLNAVGNLAPPTLKTVTRGSTNTTFEANIAILEAVHLYIKDSMRFSD
jgi:hypothetical protein